MNLFWNNRHDGFGVLVSKNDLGWGSWHGIEYACDERIIKFWLASREKVVTEDDFAVFLSSIGFDTMPAHMNNLDDLNLVWVPADTTWCIDKTPYEESIKYLSNYEWNNFSSTDTQETWNDWLHNLRNKYCEDPKMDFLTWMLTKKNVCVVEE